VDEEDYASPEDEDETGHKRRRAHLRARMKLGMCVAVRLNADDHTTPRHHKNITECPEGVAAEEDE
jgi:hypothetical protein